MQKYNRNKNKNNYNKKQEPKKELTPEEKFELMIKNWKKQAEENLGDAERRRNEKIANTRYKLSPFRFEK